MKLVPDQTPWLSVIVLNYNGMVWLPRCYDSLQKQTIFERLEIILTDNNSSDSSVVFTRDWLKQTGARGQVVQNKANLYYCGANNNGAAVASGKYLLFLNNDTWLEPDCLEKLYQETEAVDAHAATPLVLNYDDNSFQNCGAPGLDWFGLTTHMEPVQRTTEVFAACGCSLLVQKEMFKKIGGFPPELLIYADETDICWRVWIAGGRVISVPTARLHHRGAAVANPAGGSKQIESRTTDTKRFLANRNGILLLVKNGQHLLLILLIPHLILLCFEAFANLMLVRRWNHIRTSYFSAIHDVIRMRSHIQEWRRRIADFRCRSDLQMMRFIKLKPSRWAELKNLFASGPPRIDRK